MKLKLLSALIVGVCLSSLAFSQTDLRSVPVTDSARAAIGHDVAEQHVAPPSQSSPIAYGYVYESGAIASGSGNFTTSWNSSNQWYAITITSIDYYFSSYSTVVTTSVPLGNTNCQTDSVSGELLVRCYTSAGAKTQADFNFIVF